MQYTWDELFWLFFAYSFLGWVMETAAAAVKQKKFVNRGLINGPFCIIYGMASVLMSIGLHEVDGLWLFLGSMIYATSLEWIAGHLIERYYHERWWDYSKHRWNLDGYVCLTMSLVWGILGFACVKWANWLLVSVYDVLPGVIRTVCLWVLFAILVLDAMASYIIIRGRSGRLEQWEAADNQFANAAARLEKWISGKVERRIHDAYHVIEQLELEEVFGVFAEGCGFYKIVLLFFTGAILGDITEAIFCRITAGVWMSRSSVVWGPFSIVWGLAIALVTAMFYKYRNRSDIFLFMMGTFLGGAYEYFCSVFTEMVFGTVFWDYSEIPFNLGGRINLLYCFFWGIAAVVWFKCCYPWISGMIEKLPVIFGKISTWVLILFMCCNITVSCMVLLRYGQRQEHMEAEKDWQVWIDKHFEDARVERIYPNAIPVE